ncbi:MAG: hypothetical protein JWM10_790 [Myxococcaceae bacterium]|nr:hypothetical protein [Myxococcaceae bacterium]
MGWAGPMPNAKGRMVGYAVAATCDTEGCGEKIDRGLGYVCGDMHDGGEHGCGDYFCGQHLYYGGCSPLCGPCLETWEETHVCPSCGEGEDGGTLCRICKEELA